MGQWSVDDPQLLEARNSVWDHWTNSRFANDVNDALDNMAEARFLNTTNTGTLVTIGAVAILLFAVFLYLYDFYATARSDNVPLYGPYGEKQGYSNYYNKR